MNIDNIGGLPLLPPRGPPPKPSLIYTRAVPLSSHKALPTSDAPVHAWGGQRMILYVAFMAR